MKLSVGFVLQMNFSDLPISVDDLYDGSRYFTINFYDLLYNPRTVTQDGKPFHLVMYKNLVAQCYKISRILHTSYSDVLKMSTLERKYLLEFIDEESKEVQKRNDQIKQEIDSKYNKK